MIRDETNTERPSVIGPYSENDTVKITCSAYGGECQEVLYHIMMQFNSHQFTHYNNIINRYHPPTLSYISILFQSAKCERALTISSFIIKYVLRSQERTFTVFS